MLLNIVRGIDDQTTYAKVRQSTLYDGDEAYIRMLGTNDKNNPIQTILGKIKSNNTLLVDLCNINQGVVSGCDYVSGRNISKLKHKDDIVKNDGIFVFDLNNDRDIKVINSFNAEEKKLLRPFFKNSDIGRFWSNSKNSKLLLYYENELNEQKYPNVANHLKMFYEILNSRLITYNENYHWTALHRSREENVFLEEKIVVPYRSQTNSFSYNNIEWFCRSDCYVITQRTYECDLKYVLALLNSSLYYQWLYYRGKRKGETLELFGTPLSEIPLKVISKTDQQPFVDIADKILSITSSDNYDPQKPPIEQVNLEKKINQMVYKLYELTEEEIRLIENTSK